MQMNLRQRKLLPLKPQSILTRVLFTLVQKHPRSAHGQRELDIVEFLNVLGRGSNLQFNVLQPELYPRVSEQEATDVLIGLKAVDDALASRMGPVNVGPVGTLNVGAVLLDKPVTVAARHRFCGVIAVVVAADNA